MAIPIVKGKSREVILDFVEQHPDWDVDLFDGNMGMGIRVKARRGQRSIDIEGTLSRMGDIEVDRLLRDMEEQIEAAFQKSTADTLSKWTGMPITITDEMPRDRMLMMDPSLEYQTYAEFGKAAPGTTRDERTITPRRLFDSESILGQAMEKAREILKKEASEMLKKDIVNGSVFATGRMLDSIAADETKSVIKQELAKVKAAQQGEDLERARERERLRMGQWKDAPDAVRFQATIAVARGLVSEVITRRTFDSLDAQSKMDFVTRGGRVMDRLPPGEEEFVSWRDAGEILAENRQRAVDARRLKRDINARINERAQRKQRDEQLVRLQKNIELAEEKARQAKLKEAMDLLRENGMVVATTVALNASGNVSPSSPQQSTPQFDDTQTKPRRRIRLAKS